MSNEPRDRRIIRFYAPRLDRKPRTIRKNVTLTEAQAHCSDPTTRQEGVYFDGYDWMPGVKPKED